MTSSFPKPAQRRSGRAGDQTPDKRTQPSGPVSRQRRPTRPARVREDLNWTSGPDFGTNASGSAAAGREASQAGKEGHAPSGARPAGHGNKRDSVQEAAPVLPGIKPVLELLQSTPERVDTIFLRKGRHGKEMEHIVDLCRAAGVRFSLLDPPSFARVYSGHSQGVVARLFEAGFADLDDLLANVMDAPLPLIVVLDQVQDPGNAGTLARTLYALGGAGLVAPRHNGVYLGAAAAKAAAGALDKLPVSKVANLGEAVDSAKKLGFTIYGAASGQENEGQEGQGSGSPVVDIFSLVPRLPAMLILGSEEGGMRSSMEKRCDFLIRIPMLRDFDSLNVAQAGGIIVSWLAHHAGRKAGRSSSE